MNDETADMQQKCDWRTLAFAEERLAEVTLRETKLLVPQEFMKVCAHPLPKQDIQFGKVVVYLELHVGRVCTEYGKEAPPWINKRRMIGVVLCLVYRIVQCSMEVSFVRTNRSPLATTSQTLAHGHIEFTAIETRDKWIEVCGRTTRG